MKKWSNLNLEMSIFPKQEKDSNGKTLKRISAVASLENALPSFQEAKNISDNLIINFCEEEKVKNRMNDIKNGILNSTTAFDKKYTIILKNSFVSFLKSIILETIKRNFDNYPPNMLSKIYFFKTKEMSKEMEKLASFIDEVYKEKYDEKEYVISNSSEISKLPMLYVMSEKESFKEIDIQITCENDLNSKIPQDF